MTYSVFDVPQPADQADRIPRNFRPHDAVSAVACMLFGFLTVRYLIVSADGFATTALFLLMFLCAVWYHRKCGYRAHAGQKLQGGIICLFSLSFSLTDSSLLHTLTAVFLIGALVWYHYAVSRNHGCIPRFFAFHLRNAILSHPLNEMGAAAEVIGKTMRGSKAGSAVRMVFLGLFLSLPLTVIVGALLASADAGVAKVLETMSNMITEELVTVIWQMLLGLPVGFWIFATVYVTTNKERYPEICDTAFEAKLNDLRIIPVMGLCTSVTPICLLYLIYVISQISYFCSAFLGKLPEAMSYAQYARRGFFELCAIAVLNLLVILVLMGCGKKTEGKSNRATTVYSCTLCLFTLFIIATAIAKMVMYINAYGLTRLRLYTAWFMVLLAVVFIVILTRQFVEKLPSAQILVTAFTVMLAALCFSRPDALIAEYNINRWEKGTLKSLDIDMLCELSDDAYMVMYQHRAHFSDGEWEWITSEYYDRTYNMTPASVSAWNLSTQYLLAVMEGNGDA